MPQRESGYERKALDQYETPSWAVSSPLPISHGALYGLSPPLLPHTQPLQMC
jgi:hypothetical protein